MLESVCFGFRKGSLMASTCYQQLNCCRDQPANKLCYGVVMCAQQRVNLLKCVQKSHFFNAMKVVIHSKVRQIK